MDETTNFILKQYVDCNSLQIINEFNKDLEKNELLNIYNKIVEDITFENDSENEKIHIKLFDNKFSINNLNCYDFTKKDLVKDIFYDMNLYLKYKNYNFFCDYAEIMDLNIYEAYYLWSENIVNIYEKMYKIIDIKYALANNDFLSLCVFIDELE